MLIVIHRLFADSLKEVVPYIYPLGINTAAEVLCGHSGPLYLSGFEGSVPCSEMARVQNRFFKELKAQHKSMMACTGSLSKLRLTQTKTVIFR